MRPSGSLLRCMVLDVMLATVKAPSVVLMTSPIWRTSPGTLTVVLVLVISPRRQKMRSQAAEEKSMELEL